MSITPPGVTNKTEIYRGFEISWQEPPMTGAAWSANIATNDRQLLEMIGRSGAKVIQSPTRDEMLASAKATINIWLSGR
jgi:hypothetical protein